MVDSKKTITILGLMIKGMKIGGRCARNYFQWCTVWQQ